MIYDVASNTVVGNMGWVDLGSLWVFELETRKERLLPLGDSAFLTVKGGQDGLFRVAHHLGSNPGVSIRHQHRPEIELARLDLAEGQAAFTGDGNLWALVDPAAIVQTQAEPKLIWLHSVDPIFLDLSWYNAADYDLGYQGLVDCLSMPQVGLIAVSVQRSSKIILIDLNENRRSGELELAGRVGNPSLTRCSASQFLAIDYDVLCLADLKLRSVRCSPPLQSSSGFTRQFIGECDLRGSRCVVSRPYSGDVILIDMSTFEILERVNIDMQPLEVCMTDKTTFVTRDWKTGRAAVGDFSSV